MIHVSSIMWKIMNQASNSTPYSDNALCLLVLMIGKSYWGLQVMSSFSIWGRFLKGYFERGIFWRALKTSILNIGGGGRVAKGKREADYSLTSLLRHPRHYDTYLHDQTFKFKTPSSIRLWHSIMRHVESPFCIKEVVNAKIHHVGEHLTSKWR